MTGCGGHAAGDYGPGGRRRDGRRFFRGMEAAVTDQLENAWERFGLLYDLGVSQADFVAALSPMNYLIDTTDALRESLQNQADANRDALFYTQATANANTELASTLGEAGTKYEELQQSATAYYSSLQEQQKKALNIQQFLAFADTLKSSEKGTNDYSIAFGNLIRIARELGYVFDGTSEDLDRITNSVNLQASGLTDTADDLETTRASLAATITELLKIEGLPAEVVANLKDMFVDLDNSIPRIESINVWGDFFDGYKEQFKAGLDDAQTEVEDALGTWDDEIADTLASVFRFALNNLNIDDAAVGENLAKGLIDAIASIASSAETSGLFNTVSEFTNNILKGALVRRMKRLTPRCLPGRSCLTPTAVSSHSSWETWVSRLSRLQRSPRSCGMYTIRLISYHLYTAQTRTACARWLPDTQKPQWKSATANRP